MADTLTHVTSGSGDARRTDTVPTTILDAGQARLLALYRAFLDRQNLQEGIFCPVCRHTTHEGAKIARGDAQIAVMCAHHVWFYQGPLPAQPLESDATLIDVLPTPMVHDRILLTDGEGFDAMTVDEAKLLRAYREFLLRYALTETLDCRTCWSNGDPSGCRAFVTPTRIAVICRHRTLQFVGQTD